MQLSIPSLLAVFGALLMLVQAAPVTSLSRHMKLRRDITLFQRRNITNLFDMGSENDGTANGQSGSGQPGSGQSGSGTGGASQQVVDPAAIQSDPNEETQAGTNSSQTSCSGNVAPHSINPGGTALRALSFEEKTATLTPSCSAGIAKSYDCNCQARKLAFVNAGATSLDLAIAFLETGSQLDSSYPYGAGKTEDSANFGPFKNNWYMIRTACTQFANQSQAEWNNGAILNSNLGDAVACLQQQIAYFKGGWWGGQRDGSAGVGSMTSDIQSYKNGAQAIQNYLNEGHMTDDMGAWSEVTAI